MEEERRTAAQVRREAIEGARTLAALREVDLAKAKAIDIGDETIASWYLLQLAAVRARQARLAAAIDENVARLTTPEHPRWPDFWRQRAVLDFTCETLERLEAAGHVLVCPNCGVTGVEFEMQDPDWEGLALRGLLAGEGALAWTWHCERCQKARIDAHAAVLLRSWREGLQWTWSA